MGAIYGVVGGPGRPAGESDLAGARGVSAAWGEDGGREWRAGGVALGAVVHHDAPWSRHEVQPVVRGPLALVADARLDDREALCRALGVSPADRATTPDSELLMRAYERWGEHCAERLSGAWAFALWDARAGRLLLARDHLGQRPLVYARRPDGLLVFATDQAAVLAHPEVPRVEDEEAVVARAVKAHHRLRERTLWAGVAKVAPGGGLSAAPGEAPRPFVHWRPGPRPDPGLGSPEACAEALRDAVAAASADAVRTIHPVGAHLSGGLDSTSVAVFGQEALRADGRGLAVLLCWSPPPGPGGAHGEQRRVEEVAGAIGAPVVWFELTEAARRRQRELEVALVPSEMRMTEEVLLPEARALGARVVLSGWGGDELVSFNARGALARLARRGRWGALVREAIAPSRRIGRGPLATARALRARIAAEVVPAFVPWGGGAPSPLAALDPRAPGMLAERARFSRPRPSPRAMQVALLEHGHLTARLEAWAHAGAAHGAAYRFPLLDRRVVELCLGLPEDLWQHDGWARWVYRRACAPVLPASIAWGRPKIEAARPDMRAGALRPEDVPEGEPFATALARRAATLRT